MKTHSRILACALIAAAIVLVPSTTGADDDGGCPAKTIKEAPYCSGCSSILQAGQLAGGGCKSCNEGKSGKEKIKAVKVKVCVRTVYACDEHPDSTSAKAGTCGECSNPLEKTADMARVVFKCTGCGAEGKKAGRCKNAECKKAKNKIEARCEKSGRAPHTA